MATASPRPIGRIALLSLGCAKNLADSERLVGDLLGAGFALADGIEDADLALINTCGFIDPAKQESIDTIFAVTQRKDLGPAEGRDRRGVPGRTVREGAGEGDPRGRPVAALRRLRQDRRRRARAARPARGARRGAAQARPPDAGGLRLPEDQRRLRPEVHLLRDPVVPRRLARRTIEDLVADAKASRAAGWAR